MKYDYEDYLEAARLAKEAGNERDYIRLQSAANALKPTSATEGMSALERLQVGFARGALDVGQGIKQIAKSAAPSIFGDAEEYTKEKDEELRLYREGGLGGDLAGNLGRFGGNVAVTLPVGGALGATSRVAQGTGAAARGLQAAQRASTSLPGQLASGAAAGGVQYVEGNDGGDRAVNTILGGALGGVAQMAPAVVRGRIPRIFNREAVDVAAKRGLPMRPNMVNPNQRDAVISSAAEIQPFGNPLSPAAQTVRTARDRLTEEAKEKAGDVNFNTSARNQKDRVYSAISERGYDRVFNAPGVKGVPLDIDSKVINDVVKQLQNVNKLIPPTKRKELAATIGKMPIGGDAREWHLFRRNLGKAKGLVGKGSEKSQVGKELMEVLYNSITDNIYKGVDNLGGSAARLKKADRYWEKTKRSYEKFNPTELDSQQIVDRVRRLDSPEQSIDFLKKLDPKGREAVFGAIQQNIIERASVGVGDVGMSTGAVMADFRKMKEFLKGAEKVLPEEAKAMRGLQEYINQLQKHRVSKGSLLIEAAQTVLTRGLSMLGPRTLTQDKGINSMLKKIAEGQTEQQARASRDLTRLILSRMSGAGAARLNEGTGGGIQYDPETGRPLN